MSTLPQGKRSRKAKRRYRRLARLVNILAATSIGTWISFTVAKMVTRGQCDQLDELLELMNEQVAAVDFEFGDRRARLLATIAALSGMAQSAHFLAHVLRGEFVEVPPEEDFVLEIMRQVEEAGEPDEASLN